MILEWLPMDFSVCKANKITNEALAAPFTFFARTDEEISLVCPSAGVPGGMLIRDDGWACFRVKGPLDFSLVGILSGIASCLAAAKISIFAVSTYDTDYVLIRRDKKEAAQAALLGAGYEFKR